MGVERENLARPCAHCHTPIPPELGAAQFCCAGCEAVATLLQDQGLTRYYALAPATLPPVGAVPAHESAVWLEPLLARAETAGGALASLDLDVQGIHCAACVWLMNELFRRRGGGAGITVNPARGRVRLCYPHGRFDVAAWIADLERFGYRFGPGRKADDVRGADLTWRMGTSVALTMNVMLFSISFYFGLSPEDGTIHGVFTWLSAALSTAVVVIGGKVFFRSALLALRRGVLHLDLPIALGIALVYATSMVRLLGGQSGERAYFDTLCTFITLMLVGRWAQERVITRNRRLLLEDDGAAGIFVHRIEAGRPVAVAATALRAGDPLLVAPGALVPVDATLTEGQGAISTDWITGEPAPRPVVAGALIPAGSFNAGRSAFVAEARTDLAGSPLLALLRQPPPAPEGSAHLRFWDHLARRWVLQVLAVAIAGLAIWLPVGADVALDVTVSLLVITCPCAIGIALPLAYEVTQSRLRRAGFFVRALDLLDRLERVRTVIFDKTGTLTLGRLVLADARSLEALEPEARDAAYNLACRSGHPVAACLARALDGTAVFTPAFTTVEEPGSGVRRDDWRLGRASWALGDASAGDDTVLARAGALIARIPLREEVRPDAARALRELAAAGYALHLLSGDTPARATALAVTVGLPAAHARGGLRPEDKAAAVATLDRQDTLYLGDGINDALAFEAALCAGTVAVGRPVLPGKSAFFLAGEGLSPLLHALAAARRLRRTARRVLALSISYNVVAVSVCLAGLMSPVRAAISMPLSSLGILLFTLLQLRPRRTPMPRLAPAEATS
jgi:Cu2+-exporting ATPase